MPAIRKITDENEVSASGLFTKYARANAASVVSRQGPLKTDQFRPMLPVAEGDSVVDLTAYSDDHPQVNYPVDAAGRRSFRTKEGKSVSPHQWAVYDFTRKVPCGRVTTYKEVCAGLGEGSPRSVGSALRKNPFAPFVPCHRVIASSLFVGGFCGEWGTQATEGSMCDKKVKMLAQEGVGFTADGYLMNSKVILWRGGSKPAL